MHINTIQINNFRCFENFELSFRSGINVLIGDNASGKTSVLMACRQVLNAFFSGFSDENTTSPGLSGADFRQIINRGVILPDRPIRIAFSCSAEKRLLGKQFEIIKNSRKNKKALLKGLREYRDYSKYLSKEMFDVEGARIRPLPLFSFFSTEDIHKRSKLSVDKFKKEVQKPSFGYTQCLDSSGLFSRWQKRLLALQETGDPTGEVATVRRAVRRVLGEEGCDIIRDIAVRPMRGKIMCLMRDGREVEVELLSDGYLRLIDIVVDLAFRCSLLNRGVPGFGRDVCRKTRGVVLIDEVDMHLHPGLQLKVLPCLKAAFPGLQFIATTHAPMVMTAVDSTEENAVLYLKYTASAGYSVEPVRTYGLDISSVNKFVLRLPVRDAAVDGQLDTLFRLIDSGKEEKARQLLAEMRNQFGSDLPELSRAGAMLDFYLGKKDE